MSADDALAILGYLLSYKTIPVRILTDENLNVGIVLSES